ncbi:diguanylate cyclase domain-containing protein [Roseateles amylovorans]|uniref:diguanylate cyclase n=1 Tax=Roseateles amylovorans TaxID=2978473 RepID=A0ABY6AYE2_9BURK|nr:diguanylate cyclase [Roseateles amylovorans]UXH77997.1 diguanylate cyclase [Roseateles amylovorans]
MPSLLIVDDNVQLIPVMARMLAPLGQVRFATSGEDALAQMRQHAPDLVLLDAEMPGMSGYDLCQVMRCDPALDLVPVIFVTGHDDLGAELRGLSCGAVDFISKPVSEPLLIARVRTQLRLKRLTDELRRSATTDALTGLDNRGSFDQRLDAEWARAVRTGSALTLVLMDVDHFKRFNDHYGHPAGDSCLREVAAAIRDQARRPADLAARIGGEEFAVLMPDTDEAGALQAAERIRAAVAARSIPHEASLTADHVTVSLGVVSCTPDRQGSRMTVESLMAAADRALYDAKAAGRNRCAAAGPMLHAGPQVATRERVPG